MTIRKYLMMTIFSFSLGIMMMIVVAALWAVLKTIVDGDIHDFIYFKISIARTILFSTIIALIINGVKYLESRYSKKFMTIYMCLMTIGSILIDIYWQLEEVWIVSINVIIIAFMCVILYLLATKSLQSL